MNPHVLLLLPTAVSCVWLVKTFIQWLRYPAAPGPAIAAYTNYWYIWKVWQGKFEDWNFKQHAQHGKVVRVAPRMYSIDDPAAIKLMYGIYNPMPKSDWYAAWGDPRIANHNLFSATDARMHSMMRRKVSNLSAMTSIKSYEPFVETCIEILLERFDRFANTGEVFDLQHWMQCYAFDVIGELTFGSRPGFLDCGEDIGGIMQKVEGSLLFSALAGIDKLLLPILFLRFGNPAAGISEFAHRMAQVGQTDGRDSTLSGGDSKESGPETFVAKLAKLRAQSPQDYETFRMAIAPDGNVAAGSDTTSITLTAILYNIIKTPRIYQKLRDELAQAAAEGKADDPITFDQAQALPYFQMVIREAMRVHPATGLPMWRVVQEGGIELGGTHFPAGAIVGTNIWVAHRNTQVFGSDASTFRPERWDPAVTPSAKLREMEHYWMPFGAGTRTCIGKNISILEISKVIPQLLRRYDFSLLQETLRYNNMWFVKQTNVRVSIERV